MRGRRNPLETEIMERWDFQWEEECEWLWAERKVAWRPRRVMDGQDHSKEERGEARAQVELALTGGRREAAGDGCPLPVNRFAGWSCVLLLLVTHELGSQFDYRK